VTDAVHIGAEIAFLILLLVLSAYTSCAETAITSLTHGRLRYLSNEHKRQRRALTRLLEEPNELITALLLLNNLLSVTAASVMTLIVVQSMPHLAPAWQGTIATAVMTFSLLVFGEITPKNFAKHNAEWLTLLLINQVYWLSRALKPVVALFRGIAFGIVRLFGVDLREKEPVSVSDEQIETLVDAGEESGMLGETESDMIRRILDFDELTVEQVMVPRPDVRAIEVGTSLAAVRAIVSMDGHSRFPVYQDVPDNVVGTLHAKDLLREEASPARTLRDLLRPAVYVPTSQPINVLLRELRRRKVHMAVIVDEFGGMAGIVTLEDILEQIVGEIEDEYDLPATPIRRISADEAVVAGDTQILDLNRAMGIELPDDDVVTVNGLVQNLLGAIAKVGDEISTGGVTLKVEQATDREVTTVRVLVRRGDGEEAAA
jgi:CBS domain containing-hemolysin-like protein